MSHPVGCTRVWKALNDGLEPVETTLSDVERATAGGNAMFTVDEFGDRYQAHVHFIAYEDALAQMLKNAEADIRVAGHQVKRLRSEVEQAERKVADSVIRLLALEEYQRDEAVAKAVLSQAE